ncbi:MAG: hypothetical protein EOP06_15370 [Proteobacteria bacterium]|nr:MAG: hypothetical protein EOP06_15370 [Pseudomonadota bacterium]
MQKLAYTALERIHLHRPVDRVMQMTELVKGKGIFDLGALDETVLERKRDHGRWLHARLCSSASEVVGIDNSALLPESGIVTAANGRIIHANIFDLSPVVAAFGKPEILVAGELIEHLPDTLGWLQSLKRNRDLTGVELVFSTPNACNWYNGLVGLMGRESMHCDHLQIYSYKTLRTLFDRSGLQLLSLVPYHARFDEMLEAASGLHKVAVASFQKVIGALEWVSPSLAGGWIGHARI